MTRRQQAAEKRAHEERLRKAAPAMFKALERLERITALGDCYCRVWMCSNCEAKFALRLARGEGEA